MLMRTEQPNQGWWQADQIFSEPLCDPDLVAVACFAVLGILITITLASMFPLEQASNLLMLPD